VLRQDHEQRDPQLRRRSERQSRRGQPRAGPGPSRSRVELPHERARAMDFLLEPFTPMISWSSWSATVARGQMETTSNKFSDTPSRSEYDAIVIGSGPNGLAAAITLARAGLAVLVVEAKGTIGGGMRSKELTQPGFVHDVCSAVHPMAVASPFFQQLPLAKHGLEFIHPPVPLAHPLPDGRVAIMERDIHATAAALGRDGRAWSKAFGALVADAHALVEEMLCSPLHLPRHLRTMTHFARHALPSARTIASDKFRTDEAKALWAGVAAHSFLPFEQIASAAIGTALIAAGHAFGWPIARGGSQAIADALASHLQSLGGEIVVNHAVEALAALPRARAYLFDLSPYQILRIAGERFPERYRRSLERFRHGPGIFKIDWALSAPIPWRNPLCARAGTVHVGGTFDEIAAAEQAAWSEAPSPRPFVLVAQQSLFDPTRAPAGYHTGWAYCHVPRACRIDMTDFIEAQVERFAPGFTETIVARHTMRPLEVQAYNPNFIGGDITGGVNDLRQILARPALRIDPYSTPAKDLFICSASTPPGAGVHGMCGYLAAMSALRRRFR
jgi:phytoene dehydrogenase-like protein